MSGRRCAAGVLRWGALLSTNPGIHVRGDRLWGQIRPPTAFVHARVFPRLAGGHDRIDAGVLPPGRRPGRAAWRRSEGARGRDSAAVLERTGAVAIPLRHLRARVDPSPWRPCGGLPGDFQGLDVARSGRRSMTGNRRLRTRARLHSRRWRCKSSPSNDLLSTDFHSAKMRAL
jgi:hypothetical protein